MEHPKYPNSPNSPGPPSAVAHSLLAICRLAGHAFCADSGSLVDNPVVAASLLSSHGRVTESYLLALARANEGKLAAMDQKPATLVVDAGRAALVLV